MVKKGIINYIVENVKIMFEDIMSRDKERFKKQFANLLTLIRGILSPILIIISLCIHSLKLSFIIILVAALTDCFDGWYARKNGYVSEFGRVLDTICDKIFSICIIVPVMSMSVSIFIIILSIELIISLINTYLQLSGIGTKTSKLGKIKTIILDATLVVCYLSLIANIDRTIVRICLIITIISQIITCVDYFVKFVKQIKAEKLKELYKKEELI